MKPTNQNELIMGLIEKNFLYSLMFGENFQWEYETLQHVLGLGQYGCVLVLACSRKSRIGEKSVKKHAESLAHCVADRLKQTACHVLTGSYVLGKISMYLDFGGRTSGNQERCMVQDICHDVISTAELDGRLTFGIGIGGSCLMKDAHESYLEALDCIRYLENGAAMPHGTVMAHETAKPHGTVMAHETAMPYGTAMAHETVAPYENVIAYETVLSYEQSRKAGSVKYSYQELVKRLLENVERGNAEAAVWFRELLNSIEPLGMVDRKNRILEITVLASGKVQAAGGLQADGMDYVTYAKEIESLGWEALKEKAQLQMDSLVNAARFTRKIIYSELVTQTIQYIREHYQNEITLQKVADELGVTPQHLSRLFKKETGKNYIDFLTDYRIGKAKEYLLTGKVRVREAGYLVGIQDPNYFSRLFKKNEGVSPSEYVKLS